MLTIEKIEASSKQMTNELIKTKAFEEASIIFLYASLPTEVQTSFIHEIAYSKGKSVAYPRVGEEGIMHFYKVEDLKTLESHSFKNTVLKEPPLINQAKVIPGYRDLIIVPGLAFDKNGGRLGYGGGFYDRYLTTYRGLYKIGLAFAFQMIDEVPMEKWDIRLDQIITSLE